MPLHVRLVLIPVILSTLPPLPSLSTESYETQEGVLEPNRGEKMKIMKKGIQIIPQNSIHLINLQYKC